MSYIIDGDIYEAGLPTLFSIEEEFGNIAANKDIAIGAKFDAMNACLDDIDALVVEKQKTCPLMAFYVINEASRFVSENTASMARGQVKEAFALSTCGMPTLHEQALAMRLDYTSKRLEGLLKLQAFVR